MVHLEALGQHHLDDVAGADVFLGLVHGGRELFRGHVGARSRGGRAFVDIQQLMRQGHGQRPAQGIQTPHRRVVGRARIAFDVDVGHHLQGVPGVIENQNGVGDAEHHVRPIQARPLGHRHPRFKLGDRVVADEAHRTAEEAGQRGIGHRLVLRHQIAQHVQRVHVILDLAAAVGKLQLHAAAETPEQAARRAAQEGVARDVLPAFHAFQQEGGRTGKMAAQPLVGGHRRLLVGQQFAPHRDQGAVFCLGQERRFVGGAVHKQ